LSLLYLLPVTTKKLLSSNFRTLAGNHRSPPPLSRKPERQGPDVLDHVRVQASRSLLLPPHRIQLQPDVEARVVAPDARAHEDPQSVGSTQAENAFKGSALSRSDVSPMQKYRVAADDDRGHRPSRSHVYVRRCCNLSGINFNVIEGNSTLCKYKLKTTNRKLQQNCIRQINNFEW